MQTAPRDGTLVRLWLSDGTDLIGYYTDRWWGWVDYHDPLPLIRGDSRFLGWEPIDQVEPLIRRERRQPGAPVVVEPAPALGPHQPHRHRAQAGAAQMKTSKCWPISGPKSRTSTLPARAATAAAE